jgi:hypothetical protein
MAFTEATLVAQLDPGASGRTITLQSFIPGSTLTDVYAVGVVAPYAGRSRWVQVTNTNTATQASDAIKAALA